MGMPALGRFSAKRSSRSTCKSLSALHHPDMSTRIMYMHVCPNWGCIFWTGRLTQCLSRPRKLMPNPPSTESLSLIMPLPGSGRIASMIRKSTVKVLARAHTLSTPEIQALITKVNQTIPAGAMDLSGMRYNDAGAYTKCGVP